MRPKSNRPIRENGLKMTMRLLADERDIIERAASRAGFESVSIYARTRVMEAAAIDLKRPRAKP
jgi:uncharacterized protein (DUF1778 family)